MSRANGHDSPIEWTMQAQELLQSSPTGSEALPSIFLNSQLFQCLDPRVPSGVTYVVHHPSLANGGFRQHQATDVEPLPHSGGQLQQLHPKFLDQSFILKPFPPWPIFGHSCFICLCPGIENNCVAIYTGRIPRPALEVVG